MAYANLSSKALKILRFGSIGNFEAKVRAWDLLWSGWTGSNRMFVIAGKGGGVTILIFGTPHQGPDILEVPKGVENRLGVHE